MMILITGTPGTGKTSVTRILSREIGCRNVNLSKLVLEKRLAVPDASGRDTKVLDNVEELVKHLERLVEKEECLIVDTHYPSILKSLANRVRLVVVLRTQPQILYERLTRRGWSLYKVVENIEAEFLGIVKSEVDQLALDSTSEVLVIDTSNMHPREAASIILQCIKNSEKCIQIPKTEIDWTTHMPSIQFVLSLTGKVHSDQSR